MGIEMDCIIETPLDVLSRAASIVQNEEREYICNSMGLLITIV